MKNKYLITLTPLGNFFFGGEITFGDYSNEKDKPEKEKQLNYLVKGNPFPQQTTILGMLRYELLRKEGLLIPRNPDKDQRAVYLVGNNGFSSKHKESYGIIDKIYPIFVKNDKILLLPDKRLFQDANEVAKKQLHFSEIKISKGNGAYVTNYDAKHFIDEDYSDTNFTIKKEFKEIFEENPQIGIKKNYVGKTDENAFFKQTYMRMRKGFSFAFYAEFREEPKVNDITFMGADQSLFKIEIDEPVEETVFSNIENQNKKMIEQGVPDAVYQVLLLSDCKVSIDIFNYLIHSVNETQDFRFMVSSKSTVNFSKINSKDGVQKSNEKFELLARNSILFVKGKDNLSKVTSLIDEEIAFKNIGYNYYKIIKKQL